MPRPPKYFSDRLGDWLASDQPKTLHSVVHNFAEKSFALLFMVLLAIPATPLPTGGISHLFELVAMLLAMELMAGRRSVWIPQRWQGLALPYGLVHRALPLLLKGVRRLERISHPRVRQLFTNVVGYRMVGLLIFVLSFFAFVAPPFSGLDTLPALGAVIVALSMILEDIVLLVLGMLVGAIGSFVVVGLGHMIVQLLWP